MSLDCLLFHCYRHQTTTASERGVSAAFDRRTDELILAFKIDPDRFRAAFETAKVCDALFLYRNLSTGAPFHLFFVELEGSNVNEGIEQLRQTVSAFRRKVLQR